MFINSVYLKHDAIPQCGNKMIFIDSCTQNPKTFIQIIIHEQKELSFLINYKLTDKYI